MSKRKLISIIVLCLLLPVLVIGSWFLAKGKQYYIVSVLIILTALFPFFLSLERKRLKVRELVILASIIAISVASRGALFFLPQVKPMAAILIISAMAFGSEFGFVAGALSILLSNFFFGQGMWTPFQMLGMGLTVFLSSFTVRAFKIKNRFATGIISGILCFFVYGIIVDLSSVFMMVANFNLQSILSIYASGVPFNLIHAITTAVVIALVQPEITEKLERLKIKYGVFSEEKQHR